MREKTNILSFDILNLKKFLFEKVEIEEKKLNMRSQQIFSAIFRKGLKDFNDLTTIPLDLRLKLNKFFTINNSKIDQKHLSSDGTIKFLIKLFDGNKVECVYIPEKTRGTICVSSQVGCSLTCSFCRSGTQKLVKNLSTSEILDQVMLVKHELKDWGEKKIISNIVFMGQGEPLINFSNLKNAIKILKEENGLN